MSRCLAISESEEQAVVSILKGSKNPNRNIALFVLGVETGLRISELLSLTIGDVIDSSDHVREVLRVKKDKCKGKKRGRDLVLSPKAVDAIFSAVDEASRKNKSHRHRHLFAPSYRLGSISRRQAYQILSSALRKAGVKHTTGTHTMRKTAALRMQKCFTDRYAQGKTNMHPLYAVMLALGHSDIKTTQSYMAGGIEEVNQCRRMGLI